MNRLILALLLVFSLVACGLEEDFDEAKGATCVDKTAGNDLTDCYNKETSLISSYGVDDVTIAQPARTLSYTTTTFDAPDSSSSAYQATKVGSSERTLPYISAVASTTNTPKIAVAPGQTIGDDFMVCAGDPENKSIWFYRLSSNGAKKSHFKFQASHNNGYEYWEYFKDYEKEKSITNTKDVYKKKKGPIPVITGVDDFGNCVFDASTGEYTFGYASGRRYGGDQYYLGAVWADFKQEKFFVRKNDDSNSKVYENEVLKAPGTPLGRYFVEASFTKFGSYTDFTDYVKANAMFPGSEKSEPSAYIGTAGLCGAKGYTDRTNTAHVEGCKTELAAYWNNNRSAFLGPMASGTSHIVQVGNRVAQYMSVNSAFGDPSTVHQMGRLYVADDTADSNSRASSTNRVLPMAHSLDQKLVYDRINNLLLTMSLGDGTGNVTIEFAKADSAAKQSGLVLINSPSTALHGTMHSNMTFGELGGVHPIASSTNEFMVLVSFAPSYPQTGSRNLYLFRLRLEGSDLQVVWMKTYTKYFAPMKDAKSPSENPAGKHAIAPKLVPFGENFLLFYQESEIAGSGNSINGLYAMEVNPEGTLLSKIQKIGAAAMNRGDSPQMLPGGAVVWVTADRDTDSAPITYTVHRIERHRALRGGL